MSDASKPKLITLLRVAALQAVFSVAQLQGLSPFSTAFLYAQTAFGSAAVAAVVLCAAELAERGVRALFFSLVALFPYFLPYAIERRTKKPLAGWGRASCCVLHFLLLSIGRRLSVNPFALPVCGVVTACFYYVFSLCESAVDFVLTGPLSETEKAAYMLAFVAVGIGLSRIQVGYFCLFYLIVGFLIPCLAHASGGATALFAAVAMGAGYAFWSYDVSKLATLAVCALCSGMFSRSARVLSVAAGGMAMIVFALYFSEPSRAWAWQLLQYVVGGLAFLAVPKKLFVRIREGMEAAGGALALRYLLNRSRYRTAMQIGKLKDVFSQMGAILGSFPTEGQKSASLLAQAVEKEYCSACERYPVCKQNGLDDALVTLARMTLIKNKATITALPTLLEKDCPSFAGLVGRAYNLSFEVRKDVAQLKTQSALKTALAQSYCGVRDVLGAQEKAIAAPISFDFEREERIKEALSACGITCSQALITIEEDYAVTLLVKRGNYALDKIEAAVSQTLGVPSVVRLTDDSVVRGWQIVTLAEQPIFRLLTGVCGKPKEEGATGDAHAFVKLSEHRVMAALCDGMGSGEKASELSDKALSLVEEFYKAGFSHEMTTKSVNSFLRLDADESFSALDVLVFDRYEGVVDLVKLASPPCYVKRSDHTVRVDSSALPLGILGEIKPSVTTRQADDGDCFVLVSDGVSDCFSGDSLSAFINNEDARNPQRLSERIVEEAQKRQKPGRCDDMTAICCLVCRQR